jgi:hypothetical protein
MGIFMRITNLLIVLVIHFREVYKILFFESPEIPLFQHPKKFRFFSLEFELLFMFIFLEFRIIISPWHDWP